MKKCYHIPVLLTLTSFLSAQPGIQWQRSLGGSESEQARCIRQTKDGGYIIAGFTSSYNGDIFGNHGGVDYWVAKLSTTGSIQWKKALGGSDHEWAYSVDQTNDEGFVIAGFTLSNDWNVSGNHGDKDAWIVKLDKNGVLQWQKALGGSNWEDAWSVQQTTDNGYILAGRASSTDGDVTGNHGGWDYWVVKLDETGAIQWKKSYGGSLADNAYSIRQTHDDGYIVTGEADSNDGNISGNHGNGDYWVVKLSSEGAIQWQKALGTNSLDRSNEVCPTSDGGYIVIGEVSAKNGDVTVHHGGYDFWAVKLNESGEIQWQKSLGGSGEEYGKAICPTMDGGYIIAGATDSNDGDVSDNDGGQDAWLVKLNGQGEIQWKKTYGGTMAEWASSVQQTDDGGYVFAGYAWSNDGDVSGNHGGTQDMWIVKLFPENTPTSAPTSLPLDIYPNPAHQAIFLNGIRESSEAFVSISDLLGRMVYRQNMPPETASIDVSTLQSGLYLITAKMSSGQVYAGKFWKD